MKKLLSFFVTGVLAVGIISTNVFASELDNLSNYDYSKFNGKNITLNVANWGEYMAVNDDEYLDVNKAFEKLTVCNK